MGSFTLMPAGASARVVYPSAVIESGGAAFTFGYPKGFPAFRLKRSGKDTLSGAGLQQSMTQFLDVQFDFGVPYVPASDAAAWFMFIKSALQRVPFDFYPDATKTAYLTCLLMDDEAALDYRAAGCYELKTMNLRILITE
jgi:hypothetical protein